MLNNRWLAYLILLALAACAILAVWAAPRIANAQTCLSASPLYSVATNSTGADVDFAGVAGSIGNGYTGTVYVSLFNPSVSNSITGNVDEFQETTANDPAHPLLIFGQGFTLAPNRSETIAFNGQAPNGDPIAVPSGKVHFHVYGAVVNVYAEQWLRC